MSIHTAAEEADASNTEDRAIAAASAALREPPACTKTCLCQCNLTVCACHDEARLSWRSREAQLGPAPVLPRNIPMSPEVEAMAHG